MKRTTAEENAVYRVAIYTYHHHHPRYKHCTPVEKASNTKLKCTKYKDAFFTTTRPSTLYTYYTTFPWFHSPLWFPTRVVSLSLSLTHTLTVSTCSLVSTAPPATSPSLPHPLPFPTLPPQETPPHVIFVSPLD